MKRIVYSFLLVFVVAALLGAPLPALAQSGNTPDNNTSLPALLVFTSYPDAVVGRDESISFPLILRTGTTPQIVHLDMQSLPEGWTATFQGGGNIVNSVYVIPDEDSKITLKLAGPADLQPGTFDFVVKAASDVAKTSLPLALTVKEKLPPKLSMTADLPVLQGSRSTDFRFDAKLTNEGDEDLNVNLLSVAPEGFLVKFLSSGKEVTDMPLEANKSTNLTVDAKAFSDVPAGDYPFAVTAQAENAEASLDLGVRVTGEPSLIVAAPDGRLSAKVEAGKETPISLVVVNNGSAAAHAIKLSATQPQGWSVTFDPDQIPQVEPGQQANVTAKVTASDKAIAGDYMMSIDAKPQESVSASKADFRVTVTTSTLWGVAGIVLIAIAVGVVALAVARFGRR
ncbi:MAG: hypothetical protein J5I90_07030 [Caldilineales bacterium]|nr:hypothetical protein [Caldilineales bacterium]